MDARRRERRLTPTMLQGLGPLPTVERYRAGSSIAIGGRAQSVESVGSLSLTWVNNASNATGYGVERSSDGFSFSQIAQLASSATSYLDGSLAAGATYYYRTYAFNNAGSSGYSNVGVGQTQALGSAPTSPSNPTPANGATGVSTNLTLSWTSAGAQSYDVYINGAPYASNLTSPSVTIGPLVGGATYSWSVVARNSVGSTSEATWSFTTKVSPGKRGGPKK
jgi:fibronectin type 3 domain-containing protein